ncbi:MAG: DUF1905 domain-containing protein [Ignavibacteriae bacterium]|nr:DUF1905 domain-containing protein [Ignavibacteriota bacterium]
MSQTFYKLKAKVWQYAGVGGWHFVTLPKKQSAEIKATFGDMQKPWGSLPVLATIGNTSWRTSIFPDKKSGAFLLPVKAEVRKKENIVEGVVITITLEIRV